MAQAEQLFHWMRLQRKANEHSFVKLCEACEAGRQPVRALQAWRNTRRMPAAFQLGPHAAAALLKTYRRTRDVQAALGVLAELQRRQPVNEYAFNVVLRLCADVGAADEALAVVQQLRGLARGAAAAEGQGQQRGWEEGGHGAGAAQAAPRPDCRTYSAALAAVARAERWECVAQLRQWMVEERVQPDATLYAQLLACHAAVGKHRAAEEVFAEMSAGEWALHLPAL